MRGGRSAGKPTVAQQARMDAITDIGCIVARSLGLGYVPCEVHHLTLGGQARPAAARPHLTVGLKLWSHRGEPFGGRTAAQCEALFGPSYSKRPRRFREEIGTDDYLLDLQNTLIEQHKEKTSWRPAA